MQRMPCVQRDYHVLKVRVRCLCAEVPCAEECRVQRMPVCRGCLCAGVPCAEECFVRGCGIFRRGGVGAGARCFLFWGCPGKMLPALLLTDSLYAVPRRASSPLLNTVLQAANLSGLESIGEMEVMLSLP